jgi:hypothetical protein
MLSAGAVSLFLYEPGDDGAYVDPVVLGDYEYAFNQAFSDGTLIFEEGEGSAPVFRTDDAIAERYGYFQWRLFDRDEFKLIPYDSKGEVDRNASSNRTPVFVKYTGTVLGAGEPVLRWSDCIPGCYDIIVLCYDTYGDLLSGNESRKLVGGLLVDGSIHKEYQWTYRGHIYRAETSFDYLDYAEYRDMHPQRRGITTWNPQQAVKYVVTDDAVVRLADSLREAYTGWYGETADLLGQEYADFILSFVQCCTYYPAHNDTYYADYVVYGQSDYFVYPLEMLYRGTGDCEDSSILAAALYKASGYSTAIVLVPEHALVAVMLDEYTEPSYNGAYFEILSQEVGGGTYYAGETTVSTFLELGKAFYYKSDSEGTSWLSEYLDIPPNGFYPVPA